MITMKVKIILLSIAAAFVLAGCDPKYKGEIEYTAPGVMNGEWTCFMEGDPGAVYTYTTTNNNADQAGKMLLNDLGNFWRFIAEVNIDRGALSFSTPAEGVKSKYTSVSGGVLQYYDPIVKVTGGKITQGALTLPSKSVVDVIEFSVSFEDDDPAFGTDYHFKGYRKSGFAEDDEYDPSFF